MTRQLTLILWGSIIWLKLPICVKVVRLQKVWLERLMKLTSRSWSFLKPFLKGGKIISGTQDMMSLIARFNLSKITSIFRSIKQISIKLEISTGEKRRNKFQGRGGWGRGRFNGRWRNSKKKETSDTGAECRHHLHKDLPHNHLWSNCVYNPNSANYRPSTFAGRNFAGHRRGRGRGNGNGRGRGRGSGGHYSNYNRDPTRNPSPGTVKVICMRCILLIRLEWPSLTEEQLWKEAKAMICMVRTTIVSLEVDWLNSQIISL